MLLLGRRKADFLHFLPLLVILFFATSASAVSAVLGIDLGTEYIKAAVVRPGSPIEIVLTKDSKRKEAAALAFKPSRVQINDTKAFPERLYGGDALALSARYPSDVYINLKSVLGLPFKSKDVKQYLARYPGLKEFTVLRSDDRKETELWTLGFHSQGFTEDNTFMVEELLAMQLKNIKANAEALLGKDSQISDVVITVPPHFGPEEKRALQLSAHLAGLRVIGLISDGLAVGLNYATHRKFDPVSDAGKHEYHVIYDMGAGSTSATVLQFQGKTIKGPGKKNQTVQEVQVVGIGTDRTLGGDTLNDLIVGDMIEKFLASPRMEPYGLPSIEVRKHGKTMARLWKDAEKVRQVLSANSQAHTTLEGLFYEDVTFKYSLTRDHFESLAKGYAAKIARPLNDALLMANLRLDDVESVILHGGLIRTPFIQKQLEDAAGGPSKIKTNVNADEAAVMGAAFKAASVSPSYRVKDIRSIEASGTEYLISWTAEGKAKEQKIFIPTSQVGVEKQLQTRAQEDTTVIFHSDRSYDSFLVTSVRLTNLTDSAELLKTKYGCSAKDINTYFTVRLAPLDGTPEFMSGSVSCTGMEKEDGSIMDTFKGLFDRGKKAQASIEADGSDDAPSASTPLPVEDETSSGTIVTPSAAAESSSSSASSASAKVEPTPTLITIPLATRVTMVGLNRPPVGELTLMMGRLKLFDESDNTSVRRAEALNVLEATTYRIRDYLEDQAFIAASTKAIREQLSEQLAAISEWLYGDGMDAKVDDFESKLKSLKSLVDPILKRKEESGLRKDAVEAAQKQLEMAQNYMDTIKVSLKKAAEDAVSSASSVVSSVSEQVSSAAAPASDGGDLDEDPHAASSAAAAEESEPVLPKMYEYTEADLSKLTKAYDSAKAWLDEKLALQEKRKADEDPAFWVADLKNKGEEVQKVVTNLIMKQINFQPPKPKKSKTAKKEKTKTKKSKSESTSTTASVKDEL